MSASERLAPKLAKLWVKLKRCINWPMSLIKLLRIRILIGAAIAASIAMWWNSGSYQECMLNEMRGQPAWMGKIADEVCRNRYGSPK